LSQSQSHLTKKIWIAISTPFQVNFFHPIIKRLEKKFRFIITARNHDRIFSMLDAKGLDYFPVGEHGGAELEGKLHAYAQNVQQLVPIVKREKPDLLLTERWPEAVRVAFGFNVPIWTIYYDEREHHVNRMVFPLSDKVFAPSFYTSKELSQSGIDREKIVWFDGFHTCYLKDQKMDQHNPFNDLGFDPPIILVRPEPEFATFFNQKRDVLEHAVQLLACNGAKKDFNVVVIPRTENQAEYYSHYPVTVMTDTLPENPVAYADVTVGAAETMLMEAFVFCKPAISTVYWEESKPVTELHRYIPHLTDPKEVAAKTLEYLDPDEQREFSQRAKLVVDLMENPIPKFIKEINKFLAESKPVSKRAPKRRSQIEIFMGILHVAAFRPHKLTHIMQAANLSYSTIRRDIVYLKKKGLINEQNDPSGGKMFQTTMSGMELLHDWKKIEENLFS